ncbi:MAG: aspartate-semialdehyde dehydrogenase [Bacteroidales bacterium]|jgi:aspartate-semialdehyde dehydrogenase|nr:aspartate-semialdehyde dehydrogenase [Bacteroidales bacterium]
MKIAVVGATGLVGRVMLKVLEEKGFGNCDLVAAASEKSVGKSLLFAGKEVKIVSVEDAVNAKCDFAVFSAGSAVSKRYAPLFAEANCIVIDNSSAWRMSEKVPLVVPEINGRAIGKNDKIIANPNCSTIQMVMALAPLHKQYHIRRIVVSTYQSVTGTGVKAIRQLEEEERGGEASKIYPHRIHRNLFPHGGDFLANGYTTEEEKLVNETRKIFAEPSIAVSATVVRVPVTGGHSESVNVEFEQDFDLNDIRALLNGFKGINVVDEPSENKYPMPLQSEGRDEVFVGRIRRDFSQPNTLNMWVVADNLRKGAATNAIQIMQYIIDKNKL